MIEFWYLRCQYKGSMCGRIDLMCFKIPRHLTFFAPVQNQITGILLLNQGQIVFPRNNVDYAQMLGAGGGGGGDWAGNG
jgi:hypothetical protein